MNVFPDRKKKRKEEEGGGVVKIIRFPSLFKKEQGETSLQKKWKFLFIEKFDEEQSCWGKNKKKNSFFWNKYAKKN